MVEHQTGGQQQGQRIGKTLAGDIGSRTMDGFEDRRGVLGKIAGNPNFARSSALDNSHIASKGRFSRWYQDQRDQGAEYCGACQKVSSRAEVAGRILDQPTRIGTDKAVAIADAIDQRDTASRRHACQDPVRQRESPVSPKCP
jgi:hypothetical protein